MQTNDSSNTSNQVKPDEFREGDTVWCVLYGEGKVRHISEDYVYPIEVVFSDGGVVLYTSNGQYSKDANRALFFFSEPKIEASVTRPFVPTLVGKRVVVKEPACYAVCIKVGFENQETFGGEGYQFHKALVEVYEVSSENLLKP